MAAPLKPWERGLPSNPMHNNARGYSGETLSSAVGGAAPTATSDTEIQGAGRPPIPPRPNTAAASPFTSGGFSSGYGMGGFGGMMSSPFMGGYGAGYGTGYSPYNRLGGFSSMTTNNTNSLLTDAEASAQGAFQNVESVVSAFSSVSMMMESTYYALHSSFRAVIGVADQFSRLKLHLAEVASSFAVFKFIRWLIRRLQVLLRLRQAGLPEDAWKNAVKASASEAQQRFPGAGQQKSSWPFYVFVALTVFLLKKIVNSVTGHSNDSSASWTDGTGDHVVGECKYDFTGNGEDELSVQQGQRINMAPANMQPRLRENDWLLGSDGVKKGFVPASYIRILGTRKGKPKILQDPNNPLQTDDPLPSVNPPQSTPSPSSTSPSSTES